MTDGNRFCIGRVAQLGSRLARNRLREDNMTMKRRSLIIGSLATVPCLGQTACASGRFIGKLEVRWDRSRDYTFAVLRRMPPQHFHFRPTPDVWTFAQQLTHIADANLMMAAPFWGEQREYVGAARDLERGPLVAHLEDSFAYVRGAFGSLWDDQVDDSVEFMGACVPKSELLYRILDHVTHHRGQTVVYLRLQGIDPPAYPS